MNIKKALSFSLNILIAVGGTYFLCSCHEKNPDYRAHSLHANYSTYEGYDYGTQEQQDQEDLQYYEQSDSSSADLPPISPPGGPYYPQGTPQRDFPQLFPPGPRLPLQTSP